MSSCEGLMKRLGFDCRLVGKRTISVSTPFSFADGEPICFYLDDSSTEVRITDNSDTLAHFASIGFDITDRKKWKSVKQLVETFGLALTEAGEIVGAERKAREHGLINRYISAMLAIADWEREYLGLPEELEQFVQEVEMYLKAWKPQATLQIGPAVQGHSGRVHTFHFEQEAKLIDAARPHGIRTGSILRKAADVINAGDKRKVLVVIDDREDIERAKVEADILSSLISVMPFTRLVEQAGGKLNPRRN